MIDTSNLKPGEVVNKFEPRWYIEAAAAATEIGADDSNNKSGDGFLISLMTIMLIFIAAIGLYYIVERYM